MDSDSIKYIPLHKNHSITVNFPFLTIIILNKKHTGIFKKYWGDIEFRNKKTFIICPDVKTFKYKILVFSL